MTIGNQLDEQFNRISERLANLEDNQIELDFDPDDLRYDLESAIDDVRDSVSYNDDRIDEIEAYKCSEDEVEDIVERMLDERISDAVTDAVNEEINSRAVSWTEHLNLHDRVRELEARLNKPSLTARALRWLREGPSIKEVATNWYAGIRRGS